MTTKYDPYEHAAALGLTIETQQLRTCYALYIPTQKLILVRTRLKAAVERSVLAHEIAHHLLGHTPQQIGSWTRKQELAADRAAARLLIHPPALADAAAGSPDPGAWAIELGVTGDILNAYLNHMEDTSCSDVASRVA